jgi:PBP superfamily domain
LSKFQGNKVSTSINHQKSGVIVFAKKLAAAGLALLVTVGLTACDPPLPPEILAAQAERTVNCVDGNLTVATPAAINDVVTGWAGSLSTACKGTTLTPVAATDAKAQAVISMDGSIPATCKPFASFPIAEDGGVVAYALTDAPNLVLTPQNVQDIFSGKVTNWSDPSIVASNPDATMPSLPIHIVGTPQQVAVDALTGWFKKLGVAFTPSLAKVSAVDDGKVLANLAEGDIAITSFSNALYAYSTVAAIAVGKDLATADIGGVQLGADKSGAKPKAGGPIGYGATYPVTMALCGTDNTVARAVGRFLIRQDSQGALGSAIIAALPDSERIKAIAIVEKGLPKPKTK